MRNLIITIPAYEPSDTLVSLVRQLKDDCRAVLVVDDGSTRAASVFEALGRLERVELLHHPANRGKGAALKTAFSEILARFPDSDGTVTVDADGQHHPDDVRRVAEALAEHPDRMTLGVRNFNRNVPFRSWWGNRWTSCEFLLLTGKWIADTQTGLRGIPTALLREACDIPGERYDYEIRQLVRFAKSHRIAQLPIRTIYADGNTSSHFNPLRDTLATQKALFSSAFSTR